MIHLTSDVEPVGFNLIDQRRARNAELLGRPRAVAAVEPKRPLDVDPLHLSERLGLVAPSPPPPTPPSTPPPPAQDPRHALDGLAYFLDLPGPAPKHAAVPRLPPQPDPAHP